MLTQRSVWLTAGLCASLCLGLLTPAFGQPAAPEPKPPVQKREPRKPAPAKPAQKAQPASPGTPAPQLAQSASPPVQLKPEPTQVEWTKVCGKDPGGTEVCYTTRDFVTDKGQPAVAVAVYDVRAAKPQKVVRFLMPLGLLLQPGIRFAVDQSEMTPGRYALCFPNGCFAEAQVKDEFVSLLKTGTTLSIAARNSAGQDITLSLPAEGFGKAYDGPPIDPQVLAEQQRTLQEALQKRSDELRQRLQAQGGANPPAAAAPSQSTQPN